MTNLIDARKLAERLGVSVRTVRVMTAAGRLPAHVIVSRKLVRWNSQEIDAWVSAGCPDRATWEAMSQADEPAPSTRRGRKAVA